MWRYPRARARRSGTVSCKDSQCHSKGHVVVHRCTFKFVLSHLGSSGIKRVYLSRHVCGRQGSCVWYIDLHKNLHCATPRTPPHGAMDFGLNFLACNTWHVCSKILIKLGKAEECREYIAKLSRCFVAMEYSSRSPYSAIKGAKKGGGPSHVSEWIDRFLDGNAAVTKFVYESGIVKLNKTSAIGRRSHRFSNKKAKIGFPLFFCFLRIYKVRIHTYNAESCGCEEGGYYGNAGFQAVTSENLWPIEAFKSGFCADWLIENKFKFFECDCMTLIWANDIEHATALSAKRRGRRGN